MVDGQLSMVNCQWSMVKCQWSMVNCQWSIVNCELSIVNCQWSIVNGQWSILVLVVVVVVMCDPSKIKGSCIITHIYVYICIICPFSFLCFHLIYSIHRLGHPEAKKKSLSQKKSHAKKKRRGKGGVRTPRAPPLSPSFFFSHAIFLRKRFFFRFWMA